MAAIAWSISTTIAKRIPANLRRRCSTGANTSRTTTTAMVSGMALALTRNQMKTFLEYHPTVLHDLHESVPFLYTSTGTGPYNAWLDPIAIDEWQLLAYHEIEEMTKRGVPGVWTHGFYDGWAPNYMFYVANGHNSIGRFYETFGNGGADTRERTVGANRRQRDWFRPNPPFPRVKWSMRNNVNMQQSAILFAMNFVANNKERFLNNFYLKSKRSVAKATNEGPAAYVIPGDSRVRWKRPTWSTCCGCRALKCIRATKEFSVKDQKYPGRFLHRPHGSALFAHGRHAARHAVLQRQRSASLRRHGLDHGRDAQREDRSRH